MLLLVRPHGHQRRLVEQDIRRHQHGVIHQPHIDVVGVAGALVFELRHTRELAGICDGVEYPCQFAMGGNVRLYEQHALCGVYPAGDEQRHQLERVTAEDRRLLPHGDGVQVRHGVDAVKFFLQLCKVADGADIVADGDGAARLDGGK